MMDIAQAVDTICSFLAETLNRANRIETDGSSLPPLFDHQAVLWHQQQRSACIFAWYQSLLADLDLDAISSPSR